MNPKRTPPAPILDNISHIENPFKQKSFSANSFISSKLPGADIDLEYALKFLYSYNGSSATFNSYRREIERLLQWSWRIEQISLLNLRRENIEDFIRFCFDPPKAWIGIKNVARFKDKNGNRYPNKDWRPFVVSISKAEHSKGSVVDANKFCPSQASIKGSNTAMFLRGWLRSVTYCSGSSGTGSTTRACSSTMKMERPTGPMAATTDPPALDASGNFNFNGVVFPDRRVQPAYWEVKQVYQYVDSCPVDLENGDITIVNNYDFIDSQYVYVIVLSLAQLRIANSLVSIQPSPYKALRQTLQYPDTHIAETLTGLHGRIEHVKSRFVRFAPGLSLKFSGPLPGQSALFKDGDNPFALYHLNSPKDAEFVKYTLAYAGYELNPADEPVLVIQKDGGLGIPCAIASGKQDITVVEQDPNIADLVQRHYKLTGRESKSPGIPCTNAAAIRHHPDRKLGEFAARFRRPEPGTFFYHRSNDDISSAPDRKRCCHHCSQAPLAARRRAEIVGHRLRKPQVHSSNAAML